MRRATALFIIMFGVTLATSACGGGGSSKSAHTKAKSRPIANASASQAAQGTTSTTTAATATAAARARALGAKSASSPTTSSSVPWTGHVVAMPSDFTVTVDKSCIHPAEKQGFTVHGGAPRQFLIYDVAYADGTDDYTNHYGSGSGQDKFDDQGNYSNTFVLAPNVPPGRAYLSVATSKGQLVQARTSFLIKPVNEKC